MKRQQGALRLQNSGGSDAMAQLESQGVHQTVRIPAQFHCEQRGLYPARPVLSQSPGSVAEILAALYQPKGREATAFKL